MMVLSLFRRRRRKGAVMRRNRSATWLSPSRCMGVANSSLKAFAEPRQPWLAKSMMLQNSERRFSTGVPLMAMRSLAGMARTALLWAVSAFLMFWASSMMTASQGSFFSLEASERRTP